jgi:hypothetical protein
MTKKVEMEIKRGRRKRTVLDQRKGEKRTM